MEALVEQSLVKATNAVSICTSVPEDLIYIENWESELYKGLKFRVRPLVSSSNADGFFMS